ncbi:hypothetical protein ACOSQ2_029038 [Xanthoceras sorbifolium]
MDFDKISRRCELMSLTDEDGPVAEIFEDLQAVGREKLSKSLVGQLIAHKEVNREAFRAIISTIWRTTKRVDVESIGMNSFVFRFKCQWDRKRVLEGGPWSFDKHLLILQEVDGTSRVSNIEFRYVSFWIQFHNLPLSCLNKEVGLFLGGMVGDVKEIDTGGFVDCLGKFLRVRVLIDVLVPLKRGLRVNLGVSGGCSSVLICYERLPNFCYYCGKIGHLVRDCSSCSSSLLDTSSLKYGAWIKAANPVRRRSAGNRKTDSEITKKILGGNLFVNELGSDGSVVIDKTEALHADVNSWGFPLVASFSGGRPKRWKRLAREKGADMTDVPVSLGKIVSQMDDLVLNFWGSDHRVLVIDGISKLNPNRNRSSSGSSRFHFEQAWAEEEECKDIVKKFWVGSGVSNSLSRLSSCVASVTAHLGLWNKKRRKVSVLELNSLRKELAAPSVSHLLFADDSLMFVKANLEECSVLKSIFSSYEQASGLEKAIGVEEQAFFSNRERNSAQSYCPGCPNVFYELFSAPRCFNFRFA